MRTFILSFVLCMTSYLCVSQQTYDVDDKTYYLIKETDGSIVLLWNVIKGRDRYFIKQNDTLIELVNTKNENGNRNYEYKTVLTNLTSDKNLSAENVKLKLLSLKSFIDDYNALKDPEYEATKKGKLLSRFHVFGGLSNSPFLDNSDNSKNPILGLEIEFSEASDMPRHSIYFQGKQILSSDKFNYSSSQFIVGYRYRIINKKTFTLYTSLDMARYVFMRAEKMEINEDDEVEKIDIKENGFDAPFIFSLGTDIRLTNTSFLTLSYNELFSILLEKQTHFPVSFSVGYKMNL